MLIVADDLTGAADTAGAFATAGHRPIVYLNDARGRSDPVMVIDVNTREMAEPDAFVAVAAAVEQQPGRQLYVKVDSTMRGHVRTTVQAALAALAELGRKPSRVVVCPAFPALGRTVIDGAVHVDGRRLDTGDLREIFAGFAGSTGLFIPAARTDEDLAALVRSMEDDDVLWVGSAGLARHLGESLPPTAVAPLGRTRCARVVVVAGSRHERTVEQLVALDSDTLVVNAEPDDAAFEERVRSFVDAADGLVLTGGRTARAVLDMLGVDRLLVGGEVEPGVPWAVTDDADRPWTVVTKAGGFGDPSTLRRAVDFLRSHT